MEDQTTQTKTTPKYQLIEFDNKNDAMINTAVEVLEGDYQGSKWVYGKAFFNQNEDGQMIMKFEYELIESEEEQADPELVDIMGDILVEILENEISPVTKHIDSDMINDDPGLVARIEELKEEAERDRQENSIED